MTTGDAKARYEELMELHDERAESFGPLAMAFARETDLDAAGLSADDQLGLFLAISEAFPDEPRRYSARLEFLRKARGAVDRLDESNDRLAQYLDQQIQGVSEGIETYSAALVPSSGKDANSPDKQRIIVETGFPGYYLDVAQKCAMVYYREKYTLSEQQTIGLNFKGPTRRFEPENEVVHKDLPGACVPFMSVRTMGFHLMLPFDLKISRKPDDPLDAGMRIWYCTDGYSFPLRRSGDRLVSWYDLDPVDVAWDDPHLRFVSMSRVKETELGTITRELPPDLPPEFGIPASFLDRTDALGPYIQIGLDFRIWFDADETSVLTMGAPDIHEYGIQGGAGLLTRTHAVDSLESYEAASAEPWQEGLSFNYANLHLQLHPEVETAFVPYNTPIFSLYFVRNRSQVEIADVRDVR